MALIIFTFSQVSLSANSLNLPDLGSSSGRLVSQQQENALGQQWLRAFRQQAPIEEDAIVYSYTQNLIRRLAYHSELSNKSFDLLLVDNNSFNAFAVPGNVIGINTGLFHYADSEDQLASVIAHELGHLSQHHYARTLEQQKEDQWKNIAALLAGILVMATTGGTEGVAAITAAQAQAMGSQLKYSRLHEQEADRVGVETMASAGLNPSAAAYMFQKLLVNSRYRDDINQFDFLLTHPLTESRVTDAFNQSRQFPTIEDVDSFHFHLIKNRLYVLNTQAKDAIAHFKSSLNTDEFPNASRYGLALAYLKNKQLKQAKPIIEKLYQVSSHEVIYIELFIQYLHLNQEQNKAITMAEQHLALHPNNYPLAKLLGEISLATDANRGLLPLYNVVMNNGSKTTPDVWYLLSELEGKSGNIIQVHLIRAEYYASIGAYTESIKHLKFALPLLEKTDRSQDIARTRYRIEQLETSKKQSIF